jgi:triacylglycerol lipase
MLPVDYAILSQRAYTDAPTIGTAASASRMHVYGNVHVFRGSDDIDSWLHDFDVELVDVPNLGKLHAGFCSAWQAIREECLALPPPYAVAGHSLGAALAIICGAEWALRDVIVPVYAFEPPRLCGDGTMAELLRMLKVPFYATRNGRDLVTQLPLELILPGPLTSIGTPSMPVDNIADHNLSRVISALR